MPRNVVNLDALIPREDFAIKDNKGKTSGTAVEKIDIHHLDDHFLVSGLRKPDFQRETAHWSPTKVVDLIKAFIDGDLIPAVILWQAGEYVFVIDGAHRLSALIAWVRDDYGDNLQSLKFFGNRISDEQKKIADRTRKLVKTQVGAYAEFVVAKSNPENVSEEMQGRIRGLAVNFITAQWVTAADAKAAENSFFKINQSATPIDPTERRILKSRKSPNAIAARSITRAGTGHKYWSDFEQERQDKIEELGKHLYNALYEPPMGDGAVKSLDLPVAGRGYNALPFVFDLVNQTNEIKIADSTKSTQVDKDVLQDDSDGSKTVEFLERVRYFIDRITGTAAACLGPHPAVYFYTQSGSFQASSFLAFVMLIEWLETYDRLKAFADARGGLEQFLIRNKEHIGHIVHKYGSGQRSIVPIRDYFKRILEHIWAGKEGDQLEAALKDEENFAFLFVPRPTNYRASDVPTGKPFGRATKSAAFMKEALGTVTVCQICRGAIHRNSLQIDHIERKEDGGTADMKNAQISHPFCNSTYKG